MAISKPWLQTNGQHQSLHNFQQKDGSNCSFCLKTQFWGPLTNWKFEPSPKAHTHSDPNINKHVEQVKKLRMNLSWHALNFKLQAKTLYHTKKQGFGYPWLSKKFQTHPPKPAEVEPSFRKVTLPPAKLHMLFPTHLWVKEFWPQNLLPLTRPGLRPTVQNSS